MSSKTFLSRTRGSPPPAKKMRACSPERRDADDLVRVDDVVADPEERRSGAGTPVWLPLRPPVVLELRHLALDLPHDPSDLLDMVDDTTLRAVRSPSSRSLPSDSAFEFARASARFGSNPWSSSGIRPRLRSDFARPPAAVASVAPPTASVAPPWAPRRLRQSPRPCHPRTETSAIAAPAAGDVSDPRRDATSALPRGRGPRPTRPGGLAGLSPRSLRRAWPGMPPGRPRDVGNADRQECRTADDRRNHRSQRPSHGTVLRSWEARPLIFRVAPDSSRSCAPNSLGFWTNAKPGDPGRSRREGESGTGTAPTVTPSSGSPEMVLVDGPFLSEFR